MTAQQPGSHFWLMTVQTAPNSRGGHSVATLSGAITPAPSQTRQDVYDQIRKIVAYETGTDKLTILHFSLEPNQL